MRQEDMPTPIADGIWNKHSDEGDDYSYELYQALQLAEQKLALAVKALKSIDLYSWDRETQKLAYETLVQIEEGK